MDKIYELLLLINNESNVRQREIAKQTELSLGTTNTLLNYLEEQGWIDIDRSKKSYQYHLTAAGFKHLKSLMKKAKQEKIKTPAASNGTTLKEAVILAAGKAKDLAFPACLAPLEDTTVIDRTLTLLNDFGIDKITMVVGFQKEAIIDHLKNRTITFIDNDNYESTGTMASLAAATPGITENEFLVLDGDLVFEESVLQQVVQAPAQNSITVTTISGSGDEAYVDMDGAQMLVRISKDIRQMNRLSAEMIGISRLSRDFYQEMLTLYQDNENPWLNYEYLITQVAQNIQVKCVDCDNAAWSDIDNQKQYEHLLDYTYPTIKRHEADRHLQYAKEQLSEILNIPESSISQIVYAGGMTNTNYKAAINGKEYFIRIPGKCTETMINRQEEALNAQIGSALKINVDTLYINPDTGIKITLSVPGAETLTSSTVRLPQNLKQIADILHTLHTADIEFNNSFNGLEELKKYEELVEEVHAEFPADYPEVMRSLGELDEILHEKYGVIMRPCHNDLVPENFVKSDTGKIFLLDWEYAGMNDPSWDLAAFSCENAFSEKEIERFLTLYYSRKPTAAEMQKVRIFEIYQDILWSVWTIAKEASGEDFGTYGSDRYARGKKLLSEVMKHEQKQTQV